jgi:plastocyanin
MRSHGLVPLLVGALLGTGLIGPTTLAAAAPVQDCAPEQFLDRTAPGADRDITWTVSITFDPERCMEVRVGQQVRWNGSLGTHPLDPEGGDTPNPIARHQDGLVTFDAPGTFGYVCGNHPVMKGAIRVLPALTATPVPAAAPWTLAAIALALGLVGWWLVAGPRHGELGVRVPPWMPRR